MQGHKGTDARAPRRPSIHCRPITAAETVSLRHSVLWPNKDVAYVLLPEDANGWHYGAFITGQIPSVDVSGLGLPVESSDENSSGSSDPLAVISLFAEEFPAPGPSDSAVSIDNENLETAADELETQRGRVLVEGNDSNDAGSRRSIRFRKFACDSEHQGRGLGTALLAHIATVAFSQLYGNLLWCDAREATRSWYERRGLTVSGPKFYKGEVAYVRMKMVLDKTRPE
ncbi:Glucosamine 6-phosphate N-acetyltransferase [Mycena indigotica]|uniref:Glucosamine 6-phosphate N-acetyltransferase n=1 Tax=Mycena indigotica TaxID=2126181 RepID=A0A8H6SR90_9AGAR|nr:Glucosamine 6-phosphate N-acetyltransferase [Mycena indigotica]KAF7304026.1 Glucosamine 6-phosphate N-acetyltransferase [Mycena indigotica]